MKHATMTRPWHFLLAVFLFFPAFSNAATDGWFSANPLPGGNPLNDIHCGAALCVAVGYGGTIQTSSDGAIWTRRNSLTQHRLNAVTQDSRGDFWVVGDGGVILHSADGLVWDHRTSGTRLALNDIVHALLQGGTTELYVAVGNEGMILTSPDGSSWTELPVENMTIFPSLSAITFANNQFVAVGSSAGILRSFDGVNWEIGLDVQNQRLYQPTVGAILRDVTWGGTPAGGGARFVAVGEYGIVYTSTDGRTWQDTVSATSSAPAGPVLNRVVWDGAMNRFIAVGYSGRIQQIVEGAAGWTLPVAAVATDARLEGLALFGGRYLTVGGMTSATSQAFTDGQIYSATALNGPWTSLSSGPSGPAEAYHALVRTATGRIVAVGNNGAIRFSADGNDWSNAPVSTGGVTSDLLGLTVLPATGAAGEQLLASDAAGGLWQSVDDGDHWASLTLAAPVTVALNALANDGQATVIAVGDSGTILTSSDRAVSWTQTATLGVNVALRAAAWHGNRFVVVGGGANGGIVLSSSDGGATWSTPLTVSAGNALYTVIWADAACDLSNSSIATGCFIAAGAGGAVYASSDGLNWVPGMLAGTGAIIRALAWNGSDLVAVGDVVAGAGGTTPITTLYVSNGAPLTDFNNNAPVSNPFNWALHQTLAHQSLLTAVWTGRQFVAAGAEATMLVSGAPDVAVNPNPKFGVRSAVCNSLDPACSNKAIPDKLVEGVRTTYRFSLSNNANLIARGVAFEVTLPVDVQFVGAKGADVSTQAAEVTLNCPQTGSTIRCAIPDLKVSTDPTRTLNEGFNLSLTLTAQPANLPATITLAPRISATNIAAIDQNPVNNVFSFTASVAKAPLNLINEDAFGGGGGQAAYLLALLLLFGRFRRSGGLRPAQA